MIKSIVFCSCLLGICVALDESKSAGIVSVQFDNGGTGPFSYSYETSDGIKKEESGSLVPSIHEDNTQVVVVTGSYSYTGPDGVVYTVRYTADESGFHPEGDHFKVPPFVPWVKGQPHDASGSYTHDTIGDYRPEKKPPTYTTGENILDAYRTTEKPPVTPVYLPPPQKPQIVPNFVGSPQTNSPRYTYVKPPSPLTYTTGESILDAYQPPRGSTIAPQYLPSLPSDNNENNAPHLDVRFNIPTPRPDITLHSTQSPIHKVLPFDNNELFIPTRYSEEAASKLAEERIAVTPTPPRPFQLTELNPQLKEIINSLH